ncbi:MAG: ABC transporter ATP-binding protein [Opitutales bacterium]|nr:ABC transporter ATP-binding protein [Opitutales bacterium]
MTKNTPPVLRVEDVSVKFVRRTGTRKFFGIGEKEIFTAVNRVSFDVPAGKTVGLVGESGCGKSTLGRAILRLQSIDSGKIFCGDEEISRFPGARMPLPLRRKIQMIFQNPYASLNPRQTVFNILSEPLEIHFPKMTVRERADEVVALLEQVGLNADHRLRYPHEFSGGQRQRIAIARALAVKPELIVCDEPVSALDVSVQAQIVALLKKIQAATGVAYLFVAHDLAVVEDLSDFVLVMRRGEIVERGTPQEVYGSPKADYTKMLLAAVPRV